MSFQWEDWVVIFLSLVGILILLGLPSLAKRVAPKLVPPIIPAGIRYSVVGGGRDQYILPEDLATDRALWGVLVFHIRIDPWKEEDVQWYS